MIRRPPRSTPLYSSAASDVYKRQVFLLLILAAVAVIGTVVPQNQPPDQYVSRFGEVWGRLLWLGGFTQVYFSPWFLGPISLLAVNILACVVHGLPQAIKRVWQP